MELNEVQKEADSASFKAILFGGCALLLAVFVGYLLAHLAGGGPQTQPVVVAAARVGPLTQLKIEDLRVAQWPVQSLPDGTFLRPEDVIKLNQLNIGGLLPGEPVLKERLSTPDKGLGMSQMVDPNRRAFVVQVQDSVATSEILHPGAIVDVTATLTDDRTHSTVTKLVLQAVQVLAVGDSIDVERSRSGDPEQNNEGDRNKNERHRVVTLLVNNSDLELITFASRYGQIDLSLRNQNDTAVVTSQGVSMDKIMGRDKKGGVSADAGGKTAANTNVLPGDSIEGQSSPTHRPPSRSRHSNASRGPSIINVEQ